MNGLVLLVTVSLALFIGSAWTKPYVALAVEDPCAKWPTCNECVNATYCGWCEHKVVYVDGRNGTNCASVNKTGDPDNQWQCQYFQTTNCKNPLNSWKCNNKTWICEQTSPGDGLPVDQCITDCIAPTFICNNQTKQCDPTTPGHGESWDICKSVCGKEPVPSTSSPQPPKPPAQTYECDNKTFTCNKVEPGHGTSLEVCQKECKPPPAPYICDEVQLICKRDVTGQPLEICQSICGRPSNITPHDIVGNWRGFQISANYYKGEFDMKVNDVAHAVITNPDSSTYASGTIAKYGEELWLIGDDNDPTKRIRGIYHMMAGPVTSILTWAMGLPGQGVPASFDDAMYINHGTVFVFIACLDPLHCKFNVEEIMKILTTDLPLGKRAVHQISPVDECLKWPNCSICVQQQTCGWCNVPVVYEGNEVGRQCAGWNVDKTKKPFICPGVFSIVDCTPPPPPPTPPPAPTYYCNETGLTCYQTTPGHGTSWEVCNATCGHPIVPSNSTPGDLRGVWRGLELQYGYVQGEWTLKVPEGLSNVVSVIDPSGNALTANLFTVAGGAQLWLQVLDGPNEGYWLKTIWALGFGQETKMFTWAWGPPTTDGNSAVGTPGSFNQAMTSAGYREFFWIACLDEKEKAHICEFNH